MMMTMMMMMMLCETIASHWRRSDGDWKRIFFWHWWTPSCPLVVFLRFWHCLQMSRLTYLLFTGELSQSKL